MNGHVRTAFWTLIVTLLLGAYAFTWVVSQAIEAKSSTQVRELREDIVRRLETIEGILRGRR